MIIWVYQIKSWIYLIILKISIFFSVSHRNWCDVSVVFSQLLVVIQLFRKGTCDLSCLPAGTGWTMTRRRRRFSRPRPIECKSKQEQSSRQVWRGWALFPQPARDDRAVVADVSIVEFMWVRWADRQNLTISRKATTIRCGVVGDDGDGGHYRAARPVDRR